MEGCFWEGQCGEMDDEVMDIRRYSTGNEDVDVGYTVSQGQGCFALM